MSDPPLAVDVAVEAPGWEALLAPDAAAFCARAIDAAAITERATGEVAVLLGSDAQVRALNAQFRDQDKPTNVLSFPAGPGAEPGFLGDLALGLETIEAEAQAQGKTVADHAAHLLVHGFLHLMGYDHWGDAEAAAMEARERMILASLGVADPYVGEEA